MSNSEQEDDPCSSGEDWTKQKKRNTRRQSTRLSKKPRMVLADSCSSEDDDYEEEKLEKPRGKRNGLFKKRNVKPVYISERQPIEQTGISVKPIPIANSPAFSSGSFVILKNEAETFDPNLPAYIWRIDGKALLQKFEPFTEGGVLKYRSTSVYTGWSCMESDRYAPVKDINIIQSSNHKLVLTFDWAQLKLIVIDSD